MKQIILASIMLLLSNHSWAHENESPISIEPESQAVFDAGVIKYDFQLFSDLTKKAVTDKDLILENTKILHLIAYDSSLNEFNHVHPQFNGKIWSVELNLPTNGSYFIWAQGQLLDGTEFSTVVRAQIANGNPELPVLTLGDHRKSSSGSTALELSKVKLKAGQAAMINFSVTRTDGLTPEITPYLGAMAHIITASPDGDELIHVHPMAGSAPNTGMIHAVFPTEGDYRVWVQLIDHGDLKTIPLSVTVSK